MKFLVLPKNQLECALLKFMFSKKAIRIEEIFTDDLTVCSVSVK